MYSTLAKEPLIVLSRNVAKGYDDESNIITKKKYVFLFNPKKPLNREKT